jgi:hypothetical protein
MTATLPDAQALSATLNSLQSMPAHLQQLLQQQPPADWQARRAAGGFSMTEQLCHLRDIELEGYSLRLSRVLTETLPELQEIDGSALAEARHYQQQDARLALQTFGRQRLTNVALLHEHLAAQAGRKGIFGGFGVVTLWSLVQGMQQHDAEHLDEIAGLLAAV